MTLVSLRKAADFKPVLESEAKWVTPGFVLKIHKHQDSSSITSDNNDSSKRVGFIASRKVGKAVQRNRVKRRLRAAAQTIIQTKGQDHVDYVLIGRQNALTLPFEQLTKDLKWAMKRMEVLQ